MEQAGDENFRALAEASRDLVCTATLEGRVGFINRPGCHCLGIADSRRAVPSVLGQLVHADDQALVSRLLIEAVSKGIEQRSQIRFTHQQSGSAVPLSCQLFRMKRHTATDPLTAAIIGRAVDGGEDDAAAKAAHFDAAAMSRLGEMFAGIVGHDLRNPLNAILTCAHFVIQQNDDPLTKSTVQRIVSSGHRMQRMIDQLLDVTRIRGGGGIPLHVIEVDLGALVRQCVDEITPAAPDCAIRVDVAGDMTGTWDPDRVAQLISNLVGNAVQHGNAARGVDVAVDGRQSEAVGIAVHNDGAIPPELLPILFNPFRIVHQKRQKSVGLGLGLYISRQIALAHGGDLSVVSDDAEGTTFRVMLPRQPVDAPPAALASGLGADDMEILEMLATAPKATSVTAQLFGVVALHERAPQEYWRIFERYARLLDVALDDQTYKTSGEQLSNELRGIAEQLGRLGAGAREVAELHARALRQKTRAVTVAKAQAFTAEGRLVSFELMGHLLSFYRRRSGLGGSL